MAQSKIPQLAEEFAKVLHEWLTPEQMQEVIRRNNTEEYKGCCATHDFCDANMAMDEAFKRVYKKEVSIQSEVHLNRMNSAWDKAKENDFKPELINP